ncbi:MAG: helix-turn-helix transcriptional regulator [Candidatus Symbiopectobacterium sp. Dall1.0]|nr:helix-turn-helix transcriptional regulator [Candidatus Symbiopectobacterium sp. Dall1.0]
MISANKIRQLLTRKGWTQSDLANLVGVSPQAVQYWTSGKTSPKGARLRKLAEVSGLPEYWFFSENSEPLEPLTPVSATAPKEDDGSVTLEMLDACFSCGDGYVNVDFVDVVRSIELESEFAKTIIGVRNFQNIKIANAKGDSMHPTIDAGDLMLLDISINYFDGDGLYAFCFGNECYVKRLQCIKQSIVVISDNRSYREWSIEPSEVDQLFIIAKVVSCLPLQFRRLN